MADGDTKKTIGRPKLPPETPCVVCGVRPRAVLRTRSHLDSYCIECRKVKQRQWRKDERQRMANFLKGGGNG